MPIPPLALELTMAVLIGVAVVCIVVLVLILVAPWKQVRAEPPIDPDDEARVLLGRDPDEPAVESAGDVADLRPAERDDS